MRFNTYMLFSFKYNLKANLGKIWWFQSGFRTLNKRTMEQSSELDGMDDI